MIYQIESHVAQKLIDFFDKFDFIDKVVVFGSRARHDCSPKSDIDLCIYSLEMTDTEFSKLKFELDELPILYKLDIVHFEKVNKELQDNVERDGKLLFTKIIFIKDIGKVITGKTPKTNISEYWDKKDIPFVKPNDLVNSITNLDTYTTYLSIKGSKKANLVPKNSVLISCIGTIGKVATNDKEVTTNQQINSVVPNSNMYYRYLMYQLFNKKSYLKHIANAPVVPIINKSTFENIELILPTLTKQKKIANALDKASELITLRKESIKKLDELSKSIFIDMFGDPVSNPKEWDKGKLINIGEIVGGGTPSRNKSEYFKGDIPWITTVSLNKLFINEKDAVEYITKDAVKNSSTKIIPPNSIIIGMRVGVGKVSINTTEICTNQDIVSIVNISEKVLNVYLHFLITYYGQYFKSQQRGATIQGITISVLKDLNIILPPIVVQNKFATIIEKIEEQKALYEKELELLEDNFNSLLQKSFN